MAPIEKALEGGDREKWMNLEKTSLGVRYPEEANPVSWALPSPTVTQGHTPFSSDLDTPPTGIPATESQALRAQKLPVCPPQVVPGRRCPGSRRVRLLGTAFRQAFLTFLTPSFEINMVWPWAHLPPLPSSFSLFQSSLKRKTLAPVESANWVKRERALGF